MRTTVTLDPDVERMIRRRMRERGMSFEEAINDAIRASGSGSAGRPFRTATASLGEARINLDQALQVVAALEDDDLDRKIRSQR